MSVLKRYNDATSEWEPVVVGKQGPSGVVGVTAPITNTGTSEAAVIGIDQTAITVDQDQVTGLTTGTAGFTALSNGTAGISYQPVSHNYIQNGTFEVAQRGTAVAIPTDGHGLDRWWSQGPLTQTQVAMTDTDRSQIGFEGYQYYLNFTNGGDTAGAFSRIQQRIENVRTLAGQTVTISFWARNADGAKSGSARLLTEQFFGTGGSTSVFATTKDFTFTTSWARYTQTLTLPSIAGKTITGNSSLRIGIFPGFNATTDYDIDVFGVQLEAGSIATPFKRHAPSLGLEEEACKWYYERIKTFENIVGSYRFSTTVRANLKYSKKRASPSVSLASGASITNFGPAGTITSTTFTPRVESVAMSFGMDTAQTVGLSTVLNLAGGIDISAEL